MKVARLFQTIRWDFFSCFFGGESPINNGKFMGTCGKSWEMYETYGIIIGKSWGHMGDFSING